MATIAYIFAFSNSIALVIIAAVAFLLFLCFCPRNGQPRNWPLIGMLPMLLLTSFIFDSVTEVLEFCGGTFEFKGPWFGNRDMIFTADPANVQHLLSTNFSNYPKGPDTRRIFSAYGQILFAADQKDWRFHRKFGLAFFHNQQLQHFTVRINQEVLEKGLVPVLDHASEHGITIDLQDVFQRAMLDATFMMISGKNRSSLCVGLPKDVVLEALHDASDVILLRYILPERFWMFQRWLGVGAEKRLSKACEVLDEAAAKCIKIWKEQTDNISKSEHGEESLDAITFFYNGKEFLESVGGQDYTMREIVKGIIFAGTDTASPVLSWFFWLLSKNPIVESKIREELASRTCIKADMLPSGHRVKANKRIVICSYAMARMRFVAFSSGPRICPGKELAFATVLFNYQFHVGTKIAKDQPVATPAASTILRMKHGLTVKTSEAPDPARFWDEKKISYSVIHYRCSAQNIPRFSAILVFGDSAVDPGNNNYITTIAKGNHAPYGINFPGKISTGRFSDGKLVPDLLASMLGLKETIPPFLQPKLSDQELLTGVSFASAAAGFDDETFASKHNSNVQATTIS
ncbi:alkane hydroxylase MAH1-like [Coffea arabica]|uniref:Alkane hydroxylase MAH1-like n=1 Tax=Coffea arabica TaxID=13443 RepID=A0A6P6TGT2_COFAR|nr:alkane hydroxylase MAH1-like [Coffea arabica]